MSYYINWGNYFLDTRYKFFTKDIFFKSLYPVSLIGRRRNDYNVKYNVPISSLVQVATYLLSAKNPSLKNFMVLSSDSLHFFKTPKNIFFSEYRLISFIQGRNSSFYPTKIYLKWNLRFQ